MWHAVTTGERISRWLGPVSGDLELGGRFQIEGNAGGTVLQCEAPSLLEVTWEYGGGLGWVRVALIEAAEGTRLRLEHSASVDDDTRRQFGPGALGIGWELGLGGLGLHLADPTAAERRTRLRRPRLPGVRESGGRGLDGGGRRRRRWSGGGPGGGRALHRGVHRSAGGCRRGGLTVHAFDVLGDPVRRRILQLLAAGESASGEVVGVISEEFGIGQPAVSMQLKVLRESGFAHVRAAGRRRLYSIDADPLAEVDAWLSPFRQFWEQRLDALATELRRGPDSDS